MNMKTILVCGLPGSGKTYFSERLKVAVGNAEHFNADEVRKAADDWDFSEAGRLRQLRRMKGLAQETVQNGRHAILDFICPKEEFRKELAADVVVWVARTPARDFADTTAMFEPPASYDFIIRNDDDINAIIAGVIDRLHDNTKPTGLMIGRFQPWHDGHLALFEKALEKHGQVCIGVRSMPIGDKNPFDAKTVKRNIEQSLTGKYDGRYTVVVLPNIVDVVYGRDVGWTVTKIDLPPEIEAISATKIRQQMANEVSQ